MFQLLSKKLKNRKGFTLIELIVVLAILGIILAIAVPNYLGVQEASATKADEQSLKLTEKAVKLWYMDNNVVETDGFTLAPSGTDFVAASSDVAVAADGVTQALEVDDDIVSDYLESIPTPKSSTYAGKHVEVTVTPSTGVITAAWVATI